MEAITNILIKMAQNNKFIQWLVIAGCFTCGLVYIQHLTIDSQKKLSEGLQKAVEAQVICQDELRALRSDLKAVEIEMAKMKAK